MRILLVGETWSTVTTVVNGVNAFHGGSSLTNSATRFVNALQAQGFDVDHLPGERVGTDFPYTVAELATYDAIVIGDLGSDTFALTEPMYASGSPQGDRLAAVADYVAGGGGLLMMGGYMSFSGTAGLAGYGRTPLAEVLPVVISHADDRVETPGGAVATVTTRHPVLEGIEWPFPPLLGHNKVAVKRGATVVLEIGPDPLLVLGEFGAGRSAAFTSDCAPHWATTQFLEWPSYGAFFAAVVRYVAGRPPIPAEQHRG